MTASYVYFIQVMPHGPIKIGYTSGNIANRIAALQQASPHILKWIGGFRGGRVDEQAAHRLLASSVCRGEWFYPTAEVLDFVREKCPNFCEKSLTDEIFFEEYRSLVRRVIPPYNRGECEPELQKILKSSGLDHWTFWKWMHRERALDEESARKAAECASAILAERGLLQ